MPEAVDDAIVRAILGAYRNRFPVKVYVIVAVSYVRSVHNDDGIAIGCCSDPFLNATEWIFDGTVFVLAVRFTVLNVEG